MRAELLEFLGEVPQSLEAHFEWLGANPQFTGEAGVGLLSPDHALSFTRTLGRFQEVLRAVDGLVLDDNRTGCHHTYIGRPFFSGAILYLGRSGDTRIVFASLDDYRDAVETAVCERRSITEFHPFLSPPARYQGALGEVIRQQLDAPHGVEVIRALLPSLDLDDYALLRQLVSERDSLLGEAVANEICKRPRHSLQKVAEKCMAHSHLEVVIAGLRAFDAIKGLARDEKEN